MMIPVTGLEAFEFFTDFSLILKIFVLLMIMAFVFNHLGKGPLAWIVIIGLVYFILLDGWAFFGTVYVLYMILAMGFAGFLVDFFFMSQPLHAKAQKAGAEMEGPTSMDNQHQMHQLHQAQQHGHRPQMPRPG